jgi:hypothetical protein
VLSALKKITSARLAAANVPFFPAMQNTTDFVPRTFETKSLQGVLKLASLPGMIATTKKVMGGIYSNVVMAATKTANAFLALVMPEHDQKAAEVVDIAVVPPAIRKVVADASGAPMLLGNAYAGVPKPADYPDIVVQADLAARNHNPNTKMLLAIVGAAPDAVNAFQKDFARYLERTAMKRMPLNFEIVGFDTEKHFAGDFMSLFRDFNKNVQQGIQPGSHSMAALIADENLSGVVKELENRNDLLKVKVNGTREATSAVLASAEELLKSTVQAFMAKGFIPPVDLSEFKTLLAEIGVWSRALTIMAEAA